MYSPERTCLCRQSQSVSVSIMAVHVGHSPLDEFEMTTDALEVDSPVWVLEGLMGHADTMVAAVNEWQRGLA